MAESDAALSVAPSVPSAPADDQTPAFDLAGDLAPLEERPSSALSASVSTGADVSPAFDPSTVDLSRADTATLPPEWQKAQQYVRNFQSSTDRQMQELRNQLEQYQKTAQQNRTVQETAAAAAGAVMNQQNPPDPFAAIRSRLPEGDEGSIDIVRDIATTVMQPYAQAVQQYQSQLAQAVQAVRGIATLVQQLQGTSLQSEVDRARSLYGEDFINTYVQNNRQAITAKMREVNPTTQRTFSLGEAIEALSGRKPGTQENAAQAVNAVRQASQSAIAPNGTSAQTQSALNSNPQSDEDLFAMAETMGFGPRGG